MGSLITYEIQRASGARVLLPRQTDAPLGLGGPALTGGRAPDATNVSHTDDGLPTSYALTVNTVFSGTSRDDVRAQMQAVYTALQDCVRFWAGPSYYLVNGGFFAQGSFQARNHTSVKTAVVFRIADVGSPYQGEGAGRVRVVF